MKHSHRKRISLASLAAAILTLPVSAIAERIQTELSGFEEVPAVSTSATGSFRGMISPNGDAIDFELNYSGLQADILMAHIHFSQAGTNGGIVVWLCGTAAFPGPAGTSQCPQSGNVSGVITDADVVATAASQQISAGDLEAVVEAIRAGAAYVNVHTVVSPGGEIRGQIRASRR